ncbi:MAG: two-component sensor histidine kinase [Cytophagaceae bacterium]|nr:two-component sensor histidine kinase [Cytophagaceae bacterium]
MFFNSRIIAFLLGFIIAIISSVLLVITINLSFNGFIFSFLLIFLSSCLLIFLALNFFVFKEINEIYLLLEKIKKKDYQIPKKLQEDEGETSNPLILIKREIADFAKKKEQEIDELKKLESFRREFLADVSHELKTPIFAAQGFVHTLLDGAIDDLEVRDRFLGKAANSLDGLNVLVEDLITISQLEIGEIKMNYQHFDIYKLTVEIFDQLEDTALKRGTKLRFYKYSPKSCYVYADKMRIGQVITNLVVNAIKYGKEKGLVTVSFVIENESVFVSVKDDGPGIEAKHLNRIFERFYRIEKSRSKEKGGTGLGLAIVKHILEAHDTKVFVSSKAGEGTIFSFKLKKGKVINENG